METIYLAGSEQVQNAARQMSQAAQEMSRAASSIEDSLYRHRLFMDEWLTRLEYALSGKQEKGD